LASAARSAENALPEKATAKAVATKILFIK
jgi:hypothetical protein